MKSYLKCCAIAVLSAVVVGGGCSSGEKSSTTSSGERSAARGGGKNILDIVPPPEDGGNAQYDRETRDFKTGNYRYTRKWYEDRQRTTDSSGAPVPPSQQFAFTVERSNTPDNRYTLAGVTTGPQASAPPATGIELVTSTGEITTLDKFKGKPLVVVFTRGFPGYICPMCVCYTAQLANAYGDIKNRGGELLIVFPGPREKMSEFVASCAEAAQEEGLSSLPFQVCLDADLKLVERYNLKADMSRPATIVFDAAGDDTFCHIGADPSERPKIDCILKTLDRLRGAGGN